MVVGAFVVGAIFTPPDVVSQTMLALPLWILYEAGIIAASMMERQRLRAEAAGSELPVTQPGKETIPK